MFMFFDNKACQDAAVTDRALRFDLKNISGGFKTFPLHESSKYLGRCILAQKWTTGNKLEKGYQPDMATKQIRR